MHNLCELLSVLAGFASILFAAMALHIQRDRRHEQAIDARFENDLSEMYDAKEKNPKLSQTYWEHLREVCIERCRTALSNAEADRWESACRFWMLATGCALPAAVMLYLLYMRLV